MVWNLFPFKDYFSFGKSQRSQGTKSGLYWGWVTWAADLCRLQRTRSTFSGVLLIAGLPECGSVSKDTRPSLRHLCHTFICTALIASSPKAFRIIRIVSMEECASLTQFDADSLLYSLSHFECDGHIGHMVSQQCLPPTLIQWSRHCSHVHILAHSPWLSGYIDVVQTLLIILTMAGLFLNRPRTSHYLIFYWIF